MPIAAAATPACRQIEVEERVEKHERREQGGRKDDDFRTHTGSLGEHGVPPPQRVREEKLEPAGLLLTGQRACAGSDREDEPEEGEHEREELGVEETGAGREVDAGGEPEEGLERLRVLLDQVVQVA